MGLSNFFKKIFQEEKIQEPEKKQEKLVLKELENWINNRENELHSKEKELLISIKSKLLTDIEDLETKLKVLENYDFQRRKDKEKIEAIVKENWKNYISSVKRFIINLNELKETNFEKFLHKINAIFIEFEKKSYTSYEKATFLIGKEMADVKNALIAMSRYFKQVFENNQNFLQSASITSSIKLKWENLAEIDKIITQLEERINMLDKKMLNLKERSKGLLESLEKTKKSKDYIENLKKKEEIKLLKQEFIQEIYKLKDIIEFKTLGNIFHADIKKMNIINRYREDFSGSFQKDDGENILELIEEAKLNSSAIHKLIAQISEKKEDILNKESIIKTNFTDGLMPEIEKIGLEINNLKNEKDKEIKSKEKIKSKKEEEIKLIKRELKELDIIFED